MSDMPASERAARVKAQLAEHLRFLQEIGVQGFSRDPAWRKTGLDAPPDSAAESPESQSRPATSASPAEVLREIRADLGDCTRCKLHRLGRRQIVFGVGNPDADLMFVG